LRVIKKSADARKRIRFFAYAFRNMGRERHARAKATPDNPRSLSATNHLGADAVVRQRSKISASRSLKSALPE